MTAQPATGLAGPDVLAAAQLLLTQLGVTPEDLVGAPAECAPVPTFAEYIPVVAQTLGDGTRALYWSYWKRVIEWWPDRRLDEVSASELAQLAEYVRTHAVQRHNGRGGYGAVQHFTMAMRCLYKHAVDDELIPETKNPARRLARPKRPPNNRRGLERNFGYAVARAYAGHMGKPADSAATMTYVRASLHEVATALSALTGEPHPLAHS